MISRLAQPCTQQTRPALRGSGVQTDGEAKAMVDEVRLGQHNPGENEFFCFLLFLSEMCTGNSHTA